jgi:hypothetical protein
MTQVLVPAERIERSILLIRGHKVMMDADLARIYQVPTKRLNEQVKRNRHRFPDDFMFQLTIDEKAEVVANCDHLRSLRFSPTLPYPPVSHCGQPAALEAWPTRGQGKRGHLPHLLGLLPCVQERSSNF